MLQRHYSLFGMLAVISIPIFSVILLFAHNQAKPVKAVTVTPKHQPRIQSSSHKKTPGIYYKFNSQKISRTKKTDMRVPKKIKTARALPPAGLIFRPQIKSMTRLISFENAPFPFAGKTPRTKKLFFNVVEEGRKGHKTRNGHIYWADETYSDSQTLLHVPKNFNIDRKGVIVLFFHGHGAKLKRDVLARQNVPGQITKSGMNAVLVAPQFAVDAKDSSAGKFWYPKNIHRFMEETAKKLAKLHGGPRAYQAFSKMPIVVISYSGGYHPASRVLAKDAIGKRVKGVIMLDALYGDFGKFVSWIKRSGSGFFLSAYNPKTKKNNDEFKTLLEKNSVAYQTWLGRKLKPGSVTFIPVDVPHRDFVTRAWVKNPISNLLARMDDIAPRNKKTMSALLSRVLAK